MNNSRGPAGPELTRRSFLKTTGVLAAGAAVFGAKELFKKNPQATKIEISKLVEKEKNPLNEIEEIRNYYKETAEQKNIAEETLESIGKTFQEQIQTQDHITIDQATKRAIYQHWRKKYAPGSFNYEKGLLPGIERMKPWMEDIKKVFRENNIPEKYIFLAIAESHFKIDAVSDKKAIGPYQIMPDTARLASFNLIVSPSYDERLDPVKSAELCAKHLRQGYEKFGRDWSLALMDYNGGYTNEYLEHVRERESRESIIFKEMALVSAGDTLESIAEKYGTSITLLMRANPTITEPKKLQAGAQIKIPQKRNISLGDFNSWLEKKINTRIRRELKNNQYIVRPNDTFGKISERHKIDLELLRAVNPGVNERTLMVGQKIHIPSHYKNHKDVLLKILSNFKENLNYPEKFYAISDIIEEQGLMSKLEYENKDRKTVINFPIKKSVTLLTIAQEHKIKISELRRINPAIIDISKKIPRNVSVRLPNIYMTQRG